LRAKWGEGVPAPEEFLPAGLDRALLDSDVVSEPDEIGALIIASDLDAPMSWADATSRPFLLVTPEQVSRYSSALTWLKNHKVFDEIIDER
jgi:hypothetical protein